MNRKKKINKIFKKKAKQANAKNQPNSKPRYISKADRAAAESKLGSTPEQGEKLDSNNS